MSDTLEDFVNASSDLLKYRFTVQLQPNKMIEAETLLYPLAWQSIPYGREEIHKVPRDQRGVYAFGISLLSDRLPPHCYVLYVGIAGRDSNRSLRERYSDYLNNSKIRKRERIARMIGCWRPILRFYFAPVGPAVTSDDLKNIERRINTALMPPLSINDVDAETRRMLRAFG